ncbi:hypothetical protein BV898_13105 [Hypsibius exemplaris]|uniref:Uncharacterized protein n=1 Tax=Hypsibius exemplaris TaxID=2072580 RepID=A0A1W0WBM1_HYPEX|nr:hypothetical protein BV898_13105 [Hypsibius exemplaris]
MDPMTMVDVEGMDWNDWRQLTTAEAWKWLARESRNAETSLITTTTELAPVEESILGALMEGTKAETGGYGVEDLLVRLLDTLEPPHPR